MKDSNIADNSPHFEINELVRGVRHAQALKSEDSRAAEKPGKSYPSLDSETRVAVETLCAAFHLNRKPQTLRGWASAETFPEGLRPLRVNGRLAWPVSGLRLLLGQS